MSSLFFNVIFVLCLEFVIVFSVADAEQNEKTLEDHVSTSRLFMKVLGNTKPMSMAHLKRRPQRPLRSYNRRFDDGIDLKYRKTKDIRVKKREEREEVQKTEDVNTEPEKNRKKTFEVSEALSNAFAQFQKMEKEKEKHDLDDLENMQQLQYQLEWITLDSDEEMGVELINP